MSVKKEKILEKINQDAHEALDFILATGILMGQVYTYANSLKVGGRAAKKQWAIYKKLENKAHQMTNSIRIALNS